MAKKTKDTELSAQETPPVAPDSKQTKQTDQAIQVSKEEGLSPNSHYLHY